MPLLYFLCAIVQSPLWHLQPLISFITSELLGMFAIIFDLLSYSSCSCRMAACVRTNAACTRSASDSMPNPPCLTLIFSRLFMVCHATLLVLVVERKLKQNVHLHCRRCRQLYGTNCCGSCSFGSLEKLGVAVGREALLFEKRWALGGFPVLLMVQLPLFYRGAVGASGASWC
jgi:hypothetical protein